jgi:NTP pyrophosphatase (non-canonical NTP hydrolase)
MFRDVSTMNVAFGNPKGDPSNIDFDRISSQCRNIPDEYAELQEAIAEKNSVKVRDALSDLMVFALGAFHLMGVDAEEDMAAVFRSNMSKFCWTKEDMDRTKAKYTALGVPWYEEGNQHGNYLKAAEDCEDIHGNKYRKGKFLKGINFREPDFK